MELGPVDKYKVYFFVVSHLHKNDSVSDSEFQSSRILSLLAKSGPDHSQGLYCSDSIGAPVTWGFMVGHDFIPCEASFNEST